MNFGTDKTGVNRPHQGNNNGHGRSGIDMRMTRNVLIGKLAFSLSRKKTQKRLFSYT